MGIAEAGIFTGDDEVAAQYGFQATGQGQAVDGGDHWLGIGTQGVEEDHDVIQQILFAGLRGTTGLQVGASTERRPGAGHGNHPNAVVVFPRL
ncbi:hypothetical protein D3C79_798500 [compost metagenome]